MLPTEASMSGIYRPSHRWTASLQEHAALTQIKTHSMAISLNGTFPKSHLCTRPFIYPFLTVILANGTRQMLLQWRRHSCLQSILQGTFRNGT